MKKKNTCYISGIVDEGKIINSSSDLIFFLSAQDQKNISPKNDLLSKFNFVFLFVKKSLAVLPFLGE